MRHEDLCRLNEETQRRLIQEGGAAGHLQHVFDNHELTFTEIKEILSNSAEGHLEKVSEKADGINVVFSWNVAENQLKVARTGSDISRGGMNADELAKKFFGRGNVESAFNSAFKILREAIGSLSPKTQTLVFGSNANLWYSSEIIYTDATNTINYDSNNIVFHQWPVFKVTEDGVEQIDDASGVAILEKNINQMQSAVSQKDWQVRGPSMVRLKKLSDGTILSRALSEIQQAMSSVGMNDGNTVYDYMIAKMHEEIVDLNLPPKVAKAVEARAMGVPNAPTVNDIKKTTPKELHSKIADAVRAGPELQKKFIEPIETAIHRFAIEVLRGLHSTMIAQSDAEVARLRAQLSKAIKAIETSGSEAAMEVLKREMQRLGAVDNLNAPMEGIVFFYKDQAYKFTGSFAPAHQIMSLFKYGRKGIPKMDIGEQWFPRKSLFTEGGNAFDDVVPISLADFKQTWIEIVDSLRSLGLKNITAIGSTGKKAMMGDLDVAAENNFTRDEVFEEAQKKFGASNVKKVGSNIVTIRFPVYNFQEPTGEYVQVDVMLGDTKYLSWARAGTSPEKGHPDFSPVKGVVRNVLLNVINRFMAEKLFPGEQSDLDRVRYSVDFDKGLFKTTQTKRNKTPGGAPTKAWKTIKSVLISSNPDKIVEVMFGKGFKAFDLRRFEDVVDALCDSPNTSDIADEVLNSFVIEMRDLVAKNPHFLGDDPEASLLHIEQIALGE